MAGVALPSARTGRLTLPAAGQRQQPPGQQEQHDEHGRGEGERAAHPEPWRHVCPGHDASPGRDGDGLDQTGPVHGECRGPPGTGPPGGGPACISCHTIKGLTLLGGGRLGPDLTRVFERLQGRKGLAAWLSSPASPTMAPVFKEHAIQPEELLSLIALFEDSAKKGGLDDTTSLLNFFLLGVGGMVVGLISLDALWKQRFRGVRRTLVHKEDRGER